jgi:plastocyanin
VVVLLTLGLAVACSGGGSEGDGAAAGGEGETAAAPAAEVTSSTHPEPEALEEVDPPEQPGVQELHYEYGPIQITPGQNNIDFSGGQVPKPEVDGYITAIRANLVRPDGTVPPVDVIHLHHGVWANLSATEEERRNAGGLAELFFAAGEEKTDMILPAGYGYPYEANDRWLINYMLHNLLSTPDEVSITYDLWFIPADDPAAADITVARPLWMDVQKGEIYPVFDVLKDSGTDGVYTYPDDAEDPYAGGPRLNEWVVDRDSVLLGTAGHLHPGGLHTDMSVARDGETAHLFRSDAVYYEPAGAVSWDVSMTATPEDFRVGLREGDVLSISATYDTARASWYESMGIMVAWLTDGTADRDGTEAPDPFVTPPDPQDAVLTHGHLPENDNHGGEETDEFVNAVDLPDGQPADRVTIADFTYAPGDIGGIYDTVPTVRQGDSLEFFNVDGPTEPNGIWHTITACEAPCTGATGVAYPLADAEVQFDSGQLGIAGVPTAGRLEWTIPEGLEPGTYTYFCRVHPDMRGAFRVTP